MRRVMVILFVIILAAGVVLMGSGPLLAEKGLPQGISKIITDPLYKGSYWGILVKDLKSGEVVYQLNMDKLFVPASTTKLFTMSAGLDAFGPDYRFQTPIYRSGKVDSQGTLHGDLILVASGDLTMGGRTTPDDKIAYTNMDHTPVLIAVKNDKKTLEEGLSIEGDILRKMGIQTEAISISDGAGGDRGDLISPEAVVQLLSFVHQSPHFEYFHNALPILGVDGSLTHFAGPDNTARGKMSAKTGTLISGNLLNDRPVMIAKGLAGYITTAKGRELAFALYVNNTPMQTVDDFGRIGSDQGRICEVIYRNN